MATVRVSKTLSEDVERNVRKLYKARLDAKKQEQPKFTLTPDEAYAAALKSVGVTLEQLSSIPEGFLRKSDGIYLRIVDSPSSKDTTHVQYYNFRSPQGATISRPVMDAWTRSYATPAIYLNAQFVQAYSDWATSLKALNDAVDAAAAKVLSLLEKCGSANKFVKMYPDGEALLPEWAKTKMKEVVPKTSRGAKAELVITDEAANFLTEMSEAIVVNVLDDVL